MQTATQRSISALLGLLLIVAAVGIVQSSESGSAVKRTVPFTLTHQSGQFLSTGTASTCDNEAGDPVLLEFYSDWCGTCRSMAPTVDVLVRDGYAVRRIDIDQESGLARQYGVTSLPCFVVVQKGREIDRVTGIVTMERLKQKLKPEAGGQRADVADPHPAWRYERAVGWRSCVVRIFCEDGGTSRSIGSGALVRWNGRLVVLTARHVIQGAKRIVVELCTKKTHRARVMKVDAVWDCAVLELSGTPEGIEPAEADQRGDDHDSQ